MEDADAQGLRKLTEDACDEYEVLDDDDGGYGVDNKSRGKIWLPEEDVSWVSKREDEEWRVELVEWHLSDRADQSIKDSPSHCKADCRDNGGEVVLAEIWMHVDRVHCKCYQRKMQQIEEGPR